MQTRHVSASCPCRTEVPVPLWAVEYHLVFLVLEPLFPYTLGLSLSSSLSEASLDGWSLSFLTSPTGFSAFFFHP